MTQPAHIAPPVESQCWTFEDASVIQWLARALVLVAALMPIPMQAQVIIETELPSSGHPLTVALPVAEPPPGAPIVVSLHYGGPVPPYYGRGLLEQVVAPGLSALGAVMVAPDCAAGSWAQRACADSVMRAIDFAAERYRADPQRVVLAGYSKGGIGAWALSDQHPERFAAIIVMAGRALETTGGNEAAPPAYVIHGENDELFALAPIRKSVEARSRAGQRTTLVILPGVTHYDTGAFVSPLRDAAAWLDRELAR